MDYSYRYRDKGYLSAFLEGIYCLHTGRLTSERFDVSKQNAYTLNDEAQLSGKEEKLLRDENTEEKTEEKTRGGTEEKPEEKPEENTIDISIKTVVINLNRRPDRWESFQEKEGGKFLRYHRFEAIDGSLLEPTEQLQRIFDGNDYNMREGMVGCALSHIKLYIELINSDTDIYCIFEDDIDFVPQFQEKFEHLLSILPKEWDLCYLGHHVWKHYRTPEIYDKEKFPQVEKWSMLTSLERSMGGTGGYIITKKGARKLLEFINSEGMTNGIDTMQQKSCKVLNVYYSTPHLIYSECWTGDNDPDTDIQHNHHSLSIPSDEQYKNELEYYKKLGMKVKELTTYEDALQYVQDLTSVEIAVYAGLRIRTLAAMSVHPFYTLNYRKLIIVPCPTEEIQRDKFFDRLKSNSVFDISRAIKQKKVSDYRIISLGELGYIKDNLEILKVKDFLSPFDLINGGNFEKYSNLIELMLEMKEGELNMFIENFFDEKQNSSYHQTWNNATVFVNTKYDLSFPQENLTDLVRLYKKRFKELLSVIKSKKKSYFIYATRWKTHPISLYTHFIDIVSKHNPESKLLVINGASPSENSQNIIFENIPYESKYCNDHWDNDKITYDQNIFKAILQEPIKKFIV